MPVQVRFDWYDNGQNAYSIPDVFLYAAAVLPHTTDGDREAYAIDGLRVILQTISEASKRLEDKLTYISDNYIRLLKEELNTTSASIMGEIWICLDNIRRIGLFILEAKKANGTIIHAAFVDIPEPLRTDLNHQIELVKGLRDSLHHIDERLLEYFSQEGGSIMGDISWRYRPSDTEDEMFYIIHSGIDRKPKPEYSIRLDGVTRPNLTSGIYGLIIQHIGRQETPGVLRNNWPHVINEFILDEAVYVIHRLIIFLCDKYIPLTATYGNPNHSPMPGRTPKLFFGKTSDIPQRQ